MKELNKDQKITDKAFTRLIIMSVLAMLLCIVALSSSTWALFSEVKPSANNAIKAASNCALEAAVSDSNEINIALAKVNDPKKVSLVNGDYKVTLSLPKESSSGYLKISFGDSEYISEYILRHKDDDPHTLTFTIKVSEQVTSSVEVTFTPCWGTHSNSDAIGDGGSIVIS